MSFQKGHKYIGPKEGTFLGRKHTEESRKKMSMSLMGRKKYERSYHVRDSRYLKWRTKVFIRDRWTCQTCGERGYVEAHHIKPWVKFINLRYDVTNGVTLCKECHRLTR